MPGATINRLCGSGMDAVGTAARAISSGEAELMIAGGVESMSRAPFVMPKAESAFARTNAVYDTTIGWRFVNKRMKELYGVDSMPETAENVATEFKIEREAQDRMALASQQKAVAAQKAGFFDAEIVPVTIAQKKGDPIVVAKDEHPRETSLEALAKLKGVVRPDGTVTAGNASGVNDGACALRAGERARGRAPRPDAARARRRHGDGRRRAAHHGHRPGAGDAQGARADRPGARRRSTSSSSTRRSPRKASRCCATSASPTTTRASTRTAARSRSAIRSARAAPASSRPRSTSCTGAAAATRCARCASASARASPWSSSASDDAGERHGACPIPASTYRSEPMSHSSILGGDRAPQQAPGRDADTLGPSDSSDSGSDVQGATRLKTEPEEGEETGGATPVVEDSDTDAGGTGERAEAVPEGARDGADIAPDRIARSKDALDSADSITGNDDSIESLADDDGDDDERRRSELKEARADPRRGGATSADAPHAVGRSTSWARSRAASAESRPAMRPTISKPNPGFW